MQDDTGVKAITAALAERFGEDIAIDPALPGLNELAQIVGHQSHRRFLPRVVAPDLLRLLCACALSAPSKSDLQQCDIVIVTDMAIRAGIVATIPDMPWIMDAPAFLVFVANGERLPTLADLHDKPFPNDHLDQFFNAAVDAAIVLATFLRAASAVGLGCCPISAVRDHPQAVSDLLRLPQRVIPVAGLCVGWPAQTGEITPRLSLRTTVIENSYGEHDSQKRSTLTTGAGRRYGRIAGNAARSGGARRIFTAGRRTRPVNTACRHVRTLAPSCAARVFVSISRSSAS